MNEAGPSDEQLSAELKKWTGGSPALHPVGELLDRHWEAAFAYARLCTDGTRAAGMLTTAAFTRLFGESLRQTGPTAAWRPHVLVAVRRIAAEWDTDGRQELLHPALRSAATGERAAARLLPPPGRRQLSRAFQRVPQASRAVLWHTEVEAEPLAVPAALLGLDQEDARVELQRARERLREECLQVHRELAPETECRRYLRMLDVTFRRGGVDVDPDLSQHLSGCGHCSRTAEQLAAFNTGLGLALAEAVLGWGARAYLDSRANRPEQSAEPAPQPDTVATPPFGEPFLPVEPPGRGGSAEPVRRDGSAGSTGSGGPAGPGRRRGSGGRDEFGGRDEPAEAPDGSGFAEAGGWDGSAEAGGWDGSAGLTSPDGTPGLTRRDTSGGLTSPDGTPGFTSRDSSAEFTSPDGSPEFTSWEGTPGFTSRDSSAEFTSPDGSPEFTSWEGTPGFTSRDSSAEFTSRDDTPGSTRPEGAAGFTSWDSAPGPTPRRTSASASASAVKAAVGGRSGDPAETVPSGRSAQRAARARRARRRNLALAVVTVGGLVVLPLVLWSVLGSGDGTEPAGGASPGPGKDAPSPGASWAGAHAGGQGPVRGRLHNLASGLCVGVVGKKAVEGAETELAPCDATPSQQWTYETDGLLRSSAAPDLCLDSHLGYSVRLAPCSATGTAGRNIRYDFTLQGALIPRWNQELALTPAATDGSGALVLKIRAPGDAQRWALDTAKPDLRMQNVNWDSDNATSPSATSRRTTPEATPTPRTSRTSPRTPDPSPPPTATESGPGPTPSATADPCSAYPYYCGGDGWGGGGYGGGGRRHR
ncbi:ricin-type beta-trefoil lectin domain protein [Streptomyces fodineus]|uniref:ricin-type beta-trefoil lectin domain protein n=1 Tax=Streptomyces fodineus TaxID=1904616 RepID=UPI000A9081AA|nr:ricin-type beta-trefoil lectin domain protein [Streptomyces fodineus]